MSGDRGYITWKPYDQNRRRLAATLAIFQEYREYLPLTVRQIYYRLVGRGVIGKDDVRPIYTLLVKARKAKVIPFEWVRDDGIVVSGGGGYLDAKERIEELEEEARRPIVVDRQSDQGQFCEIWVEAAGMVPQIKRVADEFTIPVYSGGGYRSQTAAWEAAQRAVERDVPTVLLQISDLDPDGLMIAESFAEEVAAYAKADGGSEVTTERIALTEEQVRRFDLQPDPDPVLPRSARKRAWINEHGAQKWQAEALPPDVLAREVEAAIWRYFDRATYEKQLAREKRENESLRRWTVGLP
jgi:hypothetical protein